MRLGICEKKALNSLKFFLTRENDTQKKPNSFEKLQSGVILTSTEPNIFRMLLSIKNQKFMMIWASCTFGQKNHPLHEILTQPFQ